MTNVTTITSPDSKVFCENLIKTLVGKGPSSSSYSNWSRDAKHRKDAKTFGIMEDIWPENNGPLPWRLTAQQRNLLEERMSRVVWPHYMERLYYAGIFLSNYCALFVLSCVILIPKPIYSHALLFVQLLAGHSFWTRANRMWKARRKYRLLFFMLVTQLRDQTEAVTHALNLFTWAVRRAIGQVHSYKEAQGLNILPGSTTVNTAGLEEAQRDLIVALALLEGCLPIAQLNPALHHFVHYIEFALTHGSLVLFWMMGFERNNKHMKGLVKNPHHPDVSMAIGSTRDVSAKFIKTKSGNKSLHSTLRHHPGSPHECVLWGTPRDYFPTENELGSLRMRGVNASVMNVSEYPIAWILGQHFKAGEWGHSPRCGSVITCVFQGRSFYARVNRFLKVEGDGGFGYASVKWFSAPEYPLGTPMVVKVRGDGGRLDDSWGCIIGLDEIDPSRVMVEPDPTHRCYYMMRDSGYDRVPP